MSQTPPAPGTELESAIAEHLQRERTQPVGHPDGYVPRVAAISARFDPALTQVAMAYFGVQFRGDEIPSAASDALRELDADPGEHAPVHAINAQYVDEAGFTNLVAIRYWADVTAYDAWKAARPAWTDPSRASDGVGFFSEVITPSADRFETVFSEGDELEGIGAGVGWPSGPIREHGYWGSARDRFAVSQTDSLEPSGDLQIERDGDVLVVAPLGNLALIQSGQDWSGMPQDRQRVYLEEAEPALRVAMDYLRDDGAEIGCIANRYMTVLDRDGQPRQRRFGLSWWRDLRELEKWAAGHPTHVAVFKAAMPVMMDPDPNARIWLYHEVSVVPADQQEFRYLNCHDRTGMLGVTRL
ncbi:phenylacetaldoxime dehydratase [Epidermidibacterium keratini]|uniref:Phenylacetaldoxime dehydratase n=1 Tax=Epidermidibacterium keratini TaxID=1891644 RepID=A0A7L4YRX6_9ACTN|nr:phenylacetaldoxime dehydratase family protein [Epidermidibacterium keratini]QHC01317.1 phenylacetaldoxime dehydratase [Epidermidibacterium keratini]